MNRQINIREWASKVDPYKAITSFTYEFDDLGIEIVDGFSAGSFSGSAEIEIYAEGFGVDEIRIDVTKPSLGKFETKRVTLDHGKHPQLWCALADAIQKVAEGPVEKHLDWME